MRPGRCKEKKQIWRLFYFCLSDSDQQTSLCRVSALLLILGLSLYSQAGSELLIIFEQQRYTDVS